MPTGVSIDFKGDTHLKFVFENLSPAMQKKLARQGLRSAAKKVQGDAQRGAPKLSGELAGTIRIRATSRSRVAVGMVVFTDSPHAGASEFGTSKQAPHPFMRPALENNRTNTVNDVIEDVRETIEEMRAK